MSTRNGLLLTGVTGFLGRYLLRDALAANQRVVVLVRPCQGESVQERLGNLTSFLSDSTAYQGQQPIVIEGDVREPNLGLTDVDIDWIGRNCQKVVHSAASLSFRETAQGDPWRTNVSGMEGLLALCQRTGLSEFHYLSTAFVHGRDSGIYREDELVQPSAFHNAYEESKFLSERLLRSREGLCSTIYRPSIIVGDSESGYTSSYTGFYRFIDFAVKLVQGGRATGRTPQRLRLPLRGTETWNLVPVDWVARVVQRIAANPTWHGRTFHLSTPSPVTTDLIYQVGMKTLTLADVEFSGADGIPDPNRLEELFIESIAEYFPYLNGNPQFCNRNTAQALPDLPPPVLDEHRLRRLFRFAQNDRWGHRSKPIGVPGTPSAVERYIEQEFPVRVRRSALGRTLGLNTLIGLDIRGLGGGQWTCQWQHGDWLPPRRGLDSRAQVIYRTDSATFTQIHTGALAPHQAFFDQKLDITGDLEQALKLATLFSRFLEETQTDPQKAMVEAPA